MKTRNTRFRCVVALAALSIAVVSCGDDDGGSTDDGSVPATEETAAESTDADSGAEATTGDTTPATDPPPATDAEAETDSTSESGSVVDAEEPAEASPATGEPVKVMVMGSFVGPFDTSFAFDAANAAAEAVNASGAAGSPIEIVTCDDMFDINQTLECVRQAESDGVAALVVGLALNGDYVALAEQAQIPVIPVVGFQAAEFQSDVTFPIASGGAGYGAAAIAELLHQGVTNLSLVYDETNGIAKPAAESAAAGLEAQGITVSNIVPMPLDIVDASSILAAAEANGAEGAGLLVQGSQAAQFLQARDQAGSDLLVGSYDLSLEPATIEALGPAAEGVLMASPFKQLTSLDDPAVQQFFDELNAYDESITTDDWSIPGVGIGAWVGIHLLAEALANADSADAAGVLAALPTLTNFDIGMIAPIDFSTTKDVIPGFTRVFNTDFLFNEIQDGVLIPISDGYVDVFAQP